MQFAAIFEQVQTFFSGESERQIVDGKGFSDTVRLQEGSVDLSLLPENGITEQDRLSYVVSQIDSQCQIVPVGSYKKTPLGEVKINEAFRGLKFDGAAELGSYMHLRPVKQADKIDLAAREVDICNHHFLDDASLGKPSSAWTIKRDEINPNIVVLRSRLYPGFYAYSRASSRVFGGIYIGDGLKNQDLPFMI